MVPRSSAGYPAVPIELELPELDGKTPKMYRGGKICLDIHFAPLWRVTEKKNNPPRHISPTHQHQPDPRALARVH
eukprot:395847-Amphidinium_carterae.1